MYIVILSIFMVLMPVEAYLIAGYLHACIRGQYRMNISFYLGWLYEGILTSEMLRGSMILVGFFPAHPKQFWVWVIETLIFGGFLYGILKRKLEKVVRLSRSRDFRCDRAG